MDLKDFSQKQINYSLFGLLLGDGWLNNKNCKNVQLNIQHSMKQQSYVKWLEDVFKQWNIFRYSKYNKHKNSTFGEFDYCEICSDIPDKRHFLKFNRFYNDDGKKIMSEYVLKRITPLGLLFWFLDDGCFNVKYRDSLSKGIIKTDRITGYRVTRQAYISTYSYSYSDHLVAQKIFKDRFNIDIRIHKCHKNSKEFYKLYFSAENFRKFYDIVRPYLNYIPTELNYKFDMKYISSKNNEKDFLDYNMPQRTTSLNKDDNIVHSVENISKETV